MTIDREQTFFNFGWDGGAEWNMPCGYTGRILWIDLTSGESREESPDEVMDQKCVTEKQSVCPPGWGLPK